jgi:hypothetical protein
LLEQRYFIVESHDEKQQKYISRRRLQDVSFRILKGMMKITSELRIEKQFVEQYKRN